MSSLDSQDMELLRILQKEGRISYSELARRLNMPQSTVRFKVNKLVREGYIKKFIAVLDPEKLGFPIIMILLLRIDHKSLDDIFDYISQMPEVHHMFQITGRYDIVCIFHARNMDDVSRINNTIRGLEGVVDAQTLLATGRLLIKTDLPI